MPLRCPPHALFFFPIHLDCTVYILHNDLNLRAKIDGNGPLLIKIWLGEVWCWNDEFRSQHSPSHSFIDTGLLSTYYAYNCSLWYHISSCETRSRYDIGVLFKKTTQHGGTSMAAPSWFEVRGVSVWCVAYFRIPIYVHNRYIAMVWPRPVAFWVEFCTSEPLAWVDFFLILCNSTCNQNCTNTSILAGVFDLYIRKNSYKK
jgi:hypothetical protein